MHEDEAADRSRPLATNRTMDIVVALLLLTVSAIVIQDSVGLRVSWTDGGSFPSIAIDQSRFRWQEGLGPGPGSFPFWVAVILGVASLVNLVNALRGQGAGQVFVTLRPFGRVLAVLLPAIVFVALIGGLAWPASVPGIGIYVAAFLFITAFMVLVGRENMLRSLAVGVVVPMALFFLFEKWFLVPLPKGPLEAWLGY